MSIAEHERHHGEGIWLTGKQFAGIIGILISVQLGINFFALRAVIKDEIGLHNESRMAHPDTLLQLRDQRAQMMETIGKIEYKLDGIDRMLKIIAENGGFNMNGNQNKKR